MNAITAEIRRFIARLTAAGEQPLRMTVMESLATAQVEPLGAEMTRAGKRFTLGNSAAITGIAPVTALPTTAAQFTLWNTSANKTLFLEELGMYLTAGTPGVGGILLAALIKAPAQVGSTYAGTKISGANNSSASSALIVKTGVTVTDPAAPNWYPVASNFGANVTAFASSTFLEHRNIQGRICIPPAQGLCLNVVSPAGTSPLFAPFAQWVEVESDIET